MLNRARARFADALSADSSTKIVDGPTVNGLNTISVRRTSFFWLSVGQIFSGLSANREIVLKRLLDRRYATCDENQEKGLGPMKTGGGPAGCWGPHEKPGYGPWALLSTLTSFNPLRPFQKVGWHKK